MKIVDHKGIEMQSPDFRRGYLKEDKHIVHHEAVKGMKEKFHYETVKEYPNGGKDVRKVIDVPGVEAQEAWDEEVPVYRYVLYTEEELAAIEEEKNKPTPEQRIADLEEALEMLLSGVIE